MPDDHFVAKTYLKHFRHNGQLSVYRKSGGLPELKRPKEICGEIDGDVVPDFLINPQLIGDFRRLFEPFWNQALADLEAGTVSTDTKLVVSLFMSNLLGATPTSARLTREGYRHHVIETVRAYHILGARTGRDDPRLAEMLSLLDAGKLSVEVENDWARATNATHLMPFAWRLYNSDWIVIRNATPADFWTSDNPFVFEDPGPFRGGKPTLPRYLPLSPRLCLYVEMHPDTEIGAPDFAQQPSGKVRFAVSDKVPDVKFINERVVECAEELVIARSRNGLLESLVANYAQHRVSNEFLKIRQPNGFINGMRLRVWDPPKNSQTWEFPPRAT
jgi:hypothetical protein